MYADEDTDGNQAKTGEHKDEVKKPPISGQTETKPVTQPKPQWYTVALTAVKEKSSVWDKTLGDTAHGDVVRLRAGKIVQRGAPALLGDDPQIDLEPGAQQRRGLRLAPRD